MKYKIGSNETGRTVGTGGSSGDLADSGMGAQSILEIFDVNGMRASLRHSANIIHANGGNRDNILKLLGILEYLVAAIGSSQDDSVSSYVGYLVDIYNIANVHDVGFHIEQVDNFLANNPDLVNEYDPPVGIISSIFCCSSGSSVIVPIGMSGEDGGYFMINHNNDGNHGGGVA